MLLELHQITKRFPGVTALDGVSFAVERGEVHVLLGENGAGKSSLVKVLAGIQQPDGGTITFDGQPYQPRTPLDAFQRGVRVVHQELNTLPSLSVAENLLLENLPQRGGVVNYPALYRRAAELLAAVGLNIPPQTRADRLGIAQLQLLEIAKALGYDSKLLVLDEPTATLTPPEIARLFALVRGLQARGVTFIYISHRLNEIAEIGNRLTILRNGRHVTTQPVGALTLPEIVRHMVGRELRDEYVFRPDVTRGAEVLRVSELRRTPQHPPVSFAVRRGEILGVAGLVGSGRTETMRAVFGADPFASGTIRLNGQVARIRSPRDAVAQGLCLLTEDRKQQGLLLDMPIDVNTTITDLARVSHNGLLDRDTERQAASALVKQLRVKTDRIDRLPRTLSGGNQQKVVIAKWLFRGAEVLIFDEPTRGIDVGAKREIYDLIWDLAAAGKGIVVVSSDLPELIGICHRIVVFSHDAIVGEVARAEFDQERILALAYQEHAP